MIQRGERFRLALESRDPLEIGDEHLGQNLDRDLALEVCVRGAIDLAHPAAAERRDDFVGAHASTS
jgi:hypothetical protein